VYLFTATMKKDGEEIEIPEYFEFSQYLLDGEIDYDSDKV